MAHKGRLSKSLAPVVRSDKMDMIIVATARGHSEKYQYFLGHHYNGRTQCWDVAALNMWTKEITKRHYSDDQAKAHALAYWNEILQKIQEIRERHENKEDRDAICHISPWPDNKAGRASSEN